MRNLLFSLAIMMAFASCDNCIESQIIDRYYLIEVLADPGDGSGTFQAVESDKFIEFYSDGTVTSNGELCGMGIDSNSATSGTYSLDTYTISTSSCMDLNFEVTGDEVILDYPCFEPCRAKFLK
ncbi:MAG TPA: hypothetical protein EYN28_05905 [Flavobacteriales bacterium]|nr:hypothetical protein [Flavobacteriales bacterium]HIO59692.1 hypothetical protein [Flavobacteriales bacterium]